jgi:hypothetical protein
MLSMIVVGKDAHSLSTTIMDKSECGGRVTRADGERGG